MDVEEIAIRFAGELISHHGKLEGKAAEAQKAQEALESAAADILKRHDAEQNAADTLLGQWHGNAATGFAKQSAKFSKDLPTTADECKKAAKIVAEVAQALDNRHSTVGTLVDEFVAKASQVLKAGLAVTGVSTTAGLFKAVAHVNDLAGQYIKQSGGHVKDARDELEEAARKLRALQKDVDHDGVADHGKVEHRPPQQTKPSSKVDKILHNARHNVGYHEGPNNRNKWGPVGQAWCAYFATSMWRAAGVDIPKYPRVSQIYDWGEHHGTAYNRHELATHARPGDAILFGSSPQHPQHVGIIEKVQGHKITTIEGNSEDRVMRHTYTLPEDADKFYAGVHPK